MTTADRLSAALRLIATDCERSTNPTYACPGRTDWSPYAEYRDDAWCNGCIARVALAGGTFPSFGENRVAERPELAEVAAILSGGAR